MHAALLQRCDLTNGIPEPVPSVGLNSTALACFMLRGLFMVDEVAFKGLFKCADAPFLFVSISGWR